MSTHATPTNRELARLIAAARRAGTREAAGVPLAAPFFLALAIFLHAATPSAFLLSPVVGVPAGPPVIENKEESRAMRGVGLAVVASVGVVSGIATAQEAGQWRVEDGGNGHWYELIVSGPITWTDARAACEAAGGYLVTPQSDAESALLLGIANRSEHPDAWVTDFGGNAGGPWLGGFQPEDAVSAQPWAWVSGEPWDWTGWAVGEPNGGFGPGQGITLMLGWAGSNVYRGWADAGLLDYPPYPLSPSYVIEWSADCNADGLVDYGQLLAGDLDDTNGNNIPDCCEADVPCNCPADLDSSGAVNGVDLAIILNTWGTNGGKYPRADIDGDGIVGGTDLALVLGAWGECQ